jgi:SIT family siderophore-iron:H+ symporter-like MFS transporter
MSRTPYQAAAVSSWNSAAQTSSLGVIRAVIAASTQPIYAKLADFLGRPFVVCLFTLFYIIGCVLQATADSFASYTGGFVFYTLAFAGQQSECFEGLVLFLAVQGYRYRAIVMRL